MPLGWVEEQPGSTLAIAKTAAPQVRWLQVDTAKWCTELWPAHVADMQSMQGVCVQRNEGWWTYEVCIGRSVRQFHAEASAAPLVDFSLGQYQGDFGTIADTQQNRLLLAQSSSGSIYGSMAPLSSGSPEAAALVQMYTRGTPCDETGSTRETEVRFVCQGDDTVQLRSVKEVATCKYVVTVATAIACTNPELAGAAAQSDELNPIEVHCIPTGETEHPV